MTLTFTMIHENIAQANVRLDGVVDLEVRRRNLLVCA